MEHDKRDEFLNDATLAVRDLWEAATGLRMGTEETDTLNDLLTAYFPIEDFAA